MNKIKLIINNSFLDWIIYFCAISLPLEFIRLNFKYFTVSITSLNLIIGATVFSFLYKNKIVKFLKKNKIVIYLLGFFGTFILISLFIKFSLHATGILVEWFFIPIIVSSILVASLNNTKFEKKIYNAIGIYFSVIIFISIISILNLDFTYDGRLKSAWHSPNYLAMIITPLIPVFIWHISRFKGCVLKNINSYILIGIFCLIIMSQSIFGIISLVIGLSIMVPYVFSTKIIKKHKKMFLIVAIVFLITITFLFFSRGITFMQNVERSSLMSRINIWNVTKDLIVDKSLIGYGLGTFQDIYLKRQIFYKPYLEWAVPSTHNVYLMLWFSGGFFLFFIFVLIYFYSLFSLIRKFLISKNEKYIIILASTSIIIIHGLVDTTVFGITDAYLFWLLAILSLKRL